MEKRSGLPVSGLLTPSPSPYAIAPPPASAPNTHVYSYSQPSATEPACCCDATKKHMKSWKNHPGPKRISVENMGERVKTHKEKAVGWGRGVPPGRPPLYYWGTATRSRAQAQPWSAFLSAHSAGAPPVRGCQPPHPPVVVPQFQI